MLAEENKANLCSLPRLILVLVFTLLAVAVAYAAPGDLDTTFDGDGKVTTPVGSSYDYGEAVALQSDGKIVVAGYSGAGGTYDAFAVVRYNSDGNLDSTLDSDGVVTTTIGSTGNDQGHAVALQSDGKIVVVGRGTTVAYSDFAVVRYNSDGSLDTTFDDDGIVTTPIGSDNDIGWAVALQSGGKIVVAGSTLSGFYYDIAVVRYNSDGSLDTTFDGDGIVTTSVGSRDDYGYGVALQSDGKIVVAGLSDINFLYGDIAVVRYNSDGSLDTTFDGDGIVTTPISSGDDVGQAVALQSDGKIVVAGYSGTSANYAFSVARYNSNGSLDTTFDSDGVVTTTIGSSGWDQGRAVTLQSDGKVVVVGRGRTGASSDFAVVRYNSDGSLDTTFDGDGIVTTPIGSSTDWGKGVAIQSDGKIVAAGYSYNDSNHNDFAVIRYTTALTGSVSNLTVADGTTDIGSTNVKVKLNSGGPCNFDVTQHFVPPGGPPTDSGEMPIQWNITSSCSPLDIDLTLCYTDDELANGNSVTEANLVAFNNTGGATWTNQGGTVDTGNNCVTVASVTSLSSWTLATSQPSGGPTAITLRSFMARTAGDVNGFALLLALVALGAVGGTLLLWAWRRAL